MQIGTFSYPDDPGFPVRRIESVAMEDGEEYLCQFGPIPASPEYSLSFSRSGLLTVHCKFMCAVVHISVLSDIVIECSTMTIFQYNRYPPLILYKVYIASSMPDWVCYHVTLFIATRVPPPPPPPSLSLSLF